MQKVIPIRRRPLRESWPWTGFLLLLISLFVMSTPIGHSALEAMGFQASTPWDEMVKSIDGELAGYDGSVGIYIKDLKTGKIYEKNADTKFICASLIKIPIMAATLQAVEDGIISLRTDIVLRNRHRRGGSGDLKYSPGGRRVAVSYLLYKMITQSDNTATAMVVDQLGYGYLNQCFLIFGLKTTRIDPIGMQLSNRMNPARENYTTPREMGFLLERIYKHDLVNDGMSDLMLQILKGADKPTRLAEFLPEDWSLARKTGLLRGNCHDVGIVFTKKSNYVICVMTGNNHTYKEAKGFIASVGRTAYSYFRNS